MSFVKKQHIFPGTKQPPRFSDPSRAYRCVRLVDRDVDGDVARLVDVDPRDAYNRRVLRWQPAFEAATKNRVISHPDQLANFAWMFHFKWKEKSQRK